MTCNIPVESRNFSWLEFSLRRLRRSLYIPGSLFCCRAFSCFFVATGQKGCRRNPTHHLRSLSAHKQIPTSSRLHIPISSISHEPAMTTSPPFCASFSTQRPRISRFPSFRSASRASLRCVSDFRTRICFCHSQGATYHSAHTGMMFFNTYSLVVSWSGWFSGKDGEESPVGRSSVSLAAGKKDGVAKESPGGSNLFLVMRF